MNSMLQKYKFIFQIIIRFPDEYLNELLLYKLNSKVCLMKGFILDGYPKSLESTQLIF